MVESTTHNIELEDGRRMRIRYRPGRGRPLVLLHGLLDSSEGWDGLVRSTHRPSHAIDLPGFGHSDRAPWPRVGAMARQVVATLERLEIDDCILVGHSLGGAVASSVAERCPGRVSSLLVMAPAGYGRIGLAEVFAAPGLREVAMVTLPWLLRSRRAVSAAYSAAVANGLPPAAELLESLSERAERIGPGTRDAVIAIDAAGRSPRAFHRRQLGYSGPVTALWGSDDQLVPISHAENLKESVPHARLVVWSRVGHHPQVEVPERLCRLVEWTAARARPERRRRRLEAMRSEGGKVRLLAAAKGRRRPGSRGEPARHAA